MTKQSERDQFIAQLVRALPNQPAHLVAEAARLLMRHAKSHGRVAEMQCNGHPVQSSPTLPTAMVNALQAEHEAYCEKREKQLEERIKAICIGLGIEPVFGGDPRGYTVKVRLPTGVSNTLGGREDGWGVPQ